MNLRPLLRARAAFAQPATLALVAMALVILTGPAPARAGEDLKNLKVFPKDMAKRDLEGVMHGWSDALGVRCTFCHEMKVPGDFQSMDFASDAIDKKQIAREMFTMVKGLNTATLPKATGESDAAVSCVTCHRGLTNPATLDQVVLHEIDKSGAQAGVQKYHELRDKYYGSGSYDFGPDSLDSAIQTLAARSDGLDAAQALVDLKIAQYPDNADAQVQLAQVLLMKNDKAGALAAVDKALKLDPGNRRALRLKQQLGS